jgi:Fur family ferric uptake transcriptional regulator
MIEELLKNKKLRITPFRKEVLGIFIDAPNAITLPVIESKLTNFDRITLYRTIKSFIEKGVIHEIYMDGDEKQMALCPEHCTSDKHNHSQQHIHFKCKLCQNTFCLDINEIPEITVPNFVLDDLNIQATGTCERCL